MITTGTVFGRLTVVGAASSRHAHTYYRCLCECGEELTARGTRLASGEKTACLSCAAAQRVIGKYIDGYRIKAFSRSQNEAPQFVAECLQCRKQIIIPKESAKPGSMPKCDCQIRRAALFSSDLDPDFLNLF